MMEKKHKENDLVCPDSNCEYSGEKNEHGLVTDEDIWFCPNCKKKMVPRKH